MSIYFCEVAGHYVLVVIDDYSRFPEVEIVHSTSAKAVLPNLDRVFAAYGVPQVVKSDNGPPFNGHEFAQFADYLGFKHNRVTPMWPEANGEVERFMKTFGKVLRTTSNWKQPMYQFLRNYRATLHCTTGVASATALFGRPIRIKLPCHDAVPCESNLRPALMREHDAHQKLKMKTLAESRRPIKDSDIQVGDTVLVKQPKTGKFSTPYHPVPLKVTNKNHSMLTAEGGDRSVTRNSPHFKKLHQDHADPVSVDINSSAVLVSVDTNSSADPVPVDTSSSASAQAEFPLRRSARVSKSPRRLIQEM